MRIFRKNIFMCLAVLCALMFLSSTAFAGKASFEEGGDIIPPYGATGDPGGTKLTGVMYVFYENYRNVEMDPDKDPRFIADGAKFSLRLQREKSSFPRVYYDEYVGELDFGNPKGIINIFYGILETRVEADFFEGADMCIKIKSMKNEGVLDYYPNTYPYPPVHLVVLVDVEVAAKPFTDAVECGLVE